MFDSLPYDDYIVWVNDTNNKVVDSLNDTLLELRNEMTTTKKEWHETTLCELDEEVVRSFVDITGDPTMNNIESGIDMYGR